MSIIWSLFQEWVPFSVKISLKNGYWYGKTLIPAVTTLHCDYRVTTSA